MRAAVLHKIGEPLAIEEIDIDPPKEGEIRIRVAASGICHSDYSVAHGVLLTPLPVVLGHEAAGIVEEVGPGVNEIDVGDHVIAALTPHCGLCTMCKENKPFLCSRMGKTLSGMTMLDGTSRLSRAGHTVYQMAGIASFAEQAVIPAGTAIKIQKDVPLETVCLIGCGVTTGVGAALNTAAVTPGSAVAVIGCGGVGLSIIQGARIAGAKIIIAIDPIEEKRDLALTLGATHAIDPEQKEVIRSVREITGRGAHYAFEALGRLDTIEQTWSMLRPSGQAVIVGMPSVQEKISLRVGGLFQEKKITGSAYGSAIPRRDIPLFVDYYRKGQLKLDEIITRHISLEEVNEALDAMARGEGARSVIVYDN